MIDSPWIYRHRQADARLRLFCFAYAGGSLTAFSGWQNDVGPAIEICAVLLPGRGPRMAEPPVARMDALARTIASEIAAYRDLPFALFGHSMGALLAFEVARQPILLHAATPTHLFVSGCAAPQCRPESKNLHTMGDDELIRALAAYNGTPAEVLAHRELMELLLPSIRADFTVVENYQYAAGPQLAMPITVLASREDDHCRHEQLDVWQRETSGACDIRWFDGDHFFIHSARAAVIDCVSTSLGMQA